MNWRLVWTYWGIMAWVLGLAAIIYVLDFGRINPIPNATMITELELCGTPTCIDPAPQNLPYNSRSRFDAEIAKHYMRFEVAPSVQPTGVYGLFLPKISDNLDVAIDGRLIHSNSVPRRIWNAPLLISIPEPLVQNTPLVIEFTLYGRPAEGVELQPFFFAPLRVLEPHFAWRNFLGPGLALFALGLVGVLAIALTVIWNFRRNEVEYLWLGLASATAIIFLAHYGYGLPIGGYKLWTLAWMLCVSLYVLLILKFLRRFLEFPQVWPERLHTGLLVVVVVWLAISPPDYTFVFSVWSNIFITVPSGLTVLVLLWVNRTSLAPWDMRILFGCLSLSLALGVYEIYLLNVHTPTRTLHLFHWMPLVMSLACIWLILSRLIQSLKGYETLTASLNQTIGEKTEEIEANFKALEDGRRRDAIAEERERIMLDLHDGIGGQLVSTLAYMESNQVGDDKVRRALQDALRDLAMMLDSMENHESLVTLLGMLRTRLESLLSEHGLKFDWQVHAEPELPNPGPSQSLQLARIVQEAITNVIKHAEADTITIFVDETQIRISDNGTGMDVTEQTTRAGTGNGIANMKRRSKAMGVELRVQSTASGTDIILGLC